MEYTYLGDTGMEVSRLCLGCANFGTGTRPDTNWDWTVDDEETSLEIIDRAIDAGINFLDTANVYSTGESEAIVGNAIEGRDREELVVATKVFGSMGTGPNTEGLSRKHVLDQAENSLDRLGTDYIDLYQIHSWDDRTPIEETLSALDHLVETGKVRYVGASNLSAWRLVQSLYTADCEGYERFVSLQPEYNLITRRIEEQTIPACEDEGVGVVSYSPLAAGFLAGRYERDEQPGSGSRLEPLWNRLDRPENWETFDRVSELADQKDATPVQISVAWLLEREHVDAPIVGPETVDQLEEYLGALDVSLTDDERSYLEEPVDEAGRAAN